MKTKMTAYYRVSTKATQQKSSFANQPDFFRAVLQQPEYGSFEETPFYFDYGITGTKLKRDGFIQMLKDAGLRVEQISREKIPHPLYPNKTMSQDKLLVSVDNKKKPKFKEIWVKSTSRFARNINGYEILECLLLKGVYVRFLDNNIVVNSQSSLSQIRKKMDEDMAYSETLSRNAQIYLQQRTAQNILWGELYGYDYHPKDRKTGRNPYYTINNAEAEVITKIFNLAANGSSQKEIAKILTEQGYKARKGGNFAPCVIGRYIRNEKFMGLNPLGKYTGGPIFQKLDTVQIKDNYPTKETPDLPAIVSKELWHKANQIRASKVRTTNEKKQPNGIKPPQSKYSMILKCSLCGNHFVYGNNRGNYFYKCSTKANHSVNACRCGNVMGYDLTKFMQQLENGGMAELINSDSLNNILAIITLIESDIQNVKNPKLSKELSAKERAITLQINNNIEKGHTLLEMLSDASFSVDSLAQLRTTYKTLDDETKALQSELKALTEPNEQRIDRLYKLFSIAEELITNYQNHKEH